MSASDTESAFGGWVGEQVAIAVRAAIRVLLGIMRALCAHPWKVDPWIEER